MKNKQKLFREKANKGIVLVRSVDGKIEIGIHGGHIDSLQEIRGYKNDSFDLNEEATIIVAEYDMAEALALSVSITHEIVYQKMLQKKLYDKNGVMDIGKVDFTALIQEVLDEE